MAKCYTEDIGHNARTLHYSYVKATAGLKGKSTCSGLNTSLVTARWLPHWRLPLHIAAQRETREKGATRSPPHHHRKYQSRDRSAAARLPSAALRPCVPLRRRSAAGGKTTSSLPPSPWRGSACSSRQPRANGQMDGRTAPGGGAAAPGADPRRTRSEGTQRPPFRCRQWLGLSPSLARNEAALGGRGGAERSGGVKGRCWPPAYSTAMAACAFRRSIARQVGCPPQPDGTEAVHSASRPRGAVFFWRLFLLTLFVLLFQT